MDTIKITFGLAARAVWPEEQWPEIPAGGTIPDGWGDDSDAWAELSYVAAGL